MPRQCQVCTSEHRAEFEATLATMTVKAAARPLGLSYESAKRHVRDHHGQAGRSATSEAHILETFARASGYAPMDWQRSFLLETRDTLLVKGRQVGATECASVLAIHTARSKPGSTSIIISPSLRQSSEVTVRARLGLWNLGETLRQDSVSLLRLANGSRIVSLPGSARGIRGYAAELCILDEASWISGETFTAARPSTAATGGRLVIQSTPGAPVGPFYELVRNVPDGWAFAKVRSDEVPTIPPEFLERERREMAPDLFRQEYEAEFGRSATSLFTVAQVNEIFGGDP